MTATRLIRATEQLADDCDGLSIGAPATHVYNPLRYASAPYHAYLRRYADSPKRTIFLGINPGPWGMAQTGIPFGEVGAVKTWLKIRAPVRAPAGLHPARPVLGFECPRSEVSGRRLWGLFADRFGAAEDFFAEHLVLNYCPLLFLRASNNRCVNLTPDKLSARDQASLVAACNVFMTTAIKLLRPAYLIGVGAFAERRLTRLPAAGGAVIGKILHPSPASPAANRCFAQTATAQLKSLGVWR